MRDALDANLIIHYIIGEPAEQRRQVQVLLNEPGVTHCIFDVVFSEVVYVFEKYYEWERARIVEVLELFLEHFDEVLEYDRELMALVLPYYVKHKALSFNDCCLAFMAELKDAEPLFTFDKKLANQHASVKGL
ncbi:PIN domain-containing protein [Candidatus Saccharibacteria bacterium]|nr:PIN domain-containing protein [Candidatus Saccharibacteria bacterium]